MRKVRRKRGTGTHTLCVCGGSGMWYVCGMCRCCVGGVWGCVCGVCVVCTGAIWGRVCHVGGMGVCVGGVRLWPRAATRGYL